MIKRIAPILVLFQYTNGKLSMVFQTITMSAALSVALKISFWLVLPSAIIVGLAAVAIIKRSGLFDAEQKYIGSKLGIKEEI